MQNQKKSLTAATGSKKSSGDKKTYGGSGAVETGGDVKKDNSRFSRINFHGPKGRDLPVAQAKDELINSVIKHQTTIVMGETGSGKSTQLPKFLAEVFTSDEFKKKIEQSKGKISKQYVVK